MNQGYETRGMIPPFIINLLIIDLLYSQNLISPFFKFENARSPINSENDYEKYHDDGSPEILNAS